MSARERSPLPSGPARFALEAGFIILVGVVAAVLDLSPVAIVVVMGLAWVVVAVVERSTKSLGSPRPKPKPPRASPEPLDSSPAEEEPPEPAAEPEPRRRRIFTEPRPSAEAASGLDREWNLWELERRARAHAGADAVPEEWAAILMYLREFARSDGALPAQFDSLVRESFPELTRATQ
jgi:hypothetical protein